MSRSAVRAASFDEEAALRKWGNDATLHSEFTGNRSAYLAFARAEHCGLVRIHRGGTVSGRTEPAASQPAVRRVERGASADMHAIEEQARERWERDANLRAEFCENERAYLAFSRADAAGLIRVMGRRQQQEPAVQPRAPSTAQALTSAVDPRYRDRASLQESWNSKQPSLSYFYSDFEDFYQAVRSGKTGRRHSRLVSTREDLNG